MRSEKSAKCCALFIYFRSSLNGPPPPPRFFLNELSWVVDFVVKKLLAKILNWKSIWEFLTVFHSLHQKLSFNVSTRHLGRITNCQVQGERIVQFKFFISLLCLWSFAATQKATILTETSTMMMTMHTDLSSNLIHSLNFLLETFCLLYIQDDLKII